MRFGIAFVYNHAKVSVAVELAKKAEEMGFDILALSEFELHQPDIYVVLSQIAANTEKIKIGPCVTNPYTRHPGTTANAIATLDEVSNGRAFVMIGTGHVSPYMRLGISTDPKPLAVMKDFIQILRGLFRRELFSYDGHRFKTTNAYIMHECRPDIPVILGAMGPKMLELGGKYADGVCLPPVPIEYIRVMKPYLERGLSVSGRSVSDFIFGYNPLVSIKKSREEAREISKRWIVIPAMSTFFNERLRELVGLGRNDVAPAVKRMMTLSKEEMMRSPLEIDLASALKPEVLDTLIDKFGICGTVDDVIERLKECEEIGVNEIDITYADKTELRRTAELIKLTGEEIIPTLKA